MMVDSLRESSPILSCSMNPLEGIQYMLKTKVVLKGGKESSISAERPRKSRSNEPGVHGSFLNLGALAWAKEKFAPRSRVEPAWPSC
jgi:hypothetical protein